MARLRKKQVCVRVVGYTGGAGGEEGPPSPPLPFALPPWLTLQLEERAARSAEFGNSLQSSRCEIAALNVHIQKLRSQILSAKSHVSTCRTLLGRGGQEGKQPGAAASHSLVTSHLQTLVS